MKSRELATIVAALLTLAAAPVQAQSLRFSGFGDFVFGAVGGGHADPAAAQRFATFGSDPDPVSS